MRTGLPTSRTTSSGFTTWWPQRAHWLYAALMSGELPDHDGERVKSRLPVEVEVIGELSFEDGRLVVSDPFAMGSGQHPIRQAVTSSPYQVAVVRALFDADPLVAAALLFSSSGQVERWEMATWGDVEPGSFEGDEFLGIDVSSTSVCFGSLPAARVAGPILAADDGRLEDPVSRVLFSDDPSRDAALVEVQDGAPPVAVFRAGWGDGCYPTWLGLDAHGQVAVVVLDLLVTNDPYMVP